MRIVLAMVFAVAMAGTALAEDSPGYHFELAAQPVKTGNTLRVKIRIVHASDGEPVVGASLAGLRFDMGPEGMASMNAPAKTVANPEPGIYEVDARPSMPGKWALGMSVTVPNRPPVEGSVIVRVPK
jgi:YtkA-like